MARRNHRIIGFNCHVWLYFTSLDVTLRLVMHSEDKSDFHVFVVFSINSLIMQSLVISTLL
jgi:hypothetical protein